MADPIISVAPPRRNPRLGGLLDAVEVREADHLASSNSAQFVADPCNFTFGDTGFCYGDLNESEDTTKVSTGITILDSAVLNFAAYYGVKCFIGPDSDVRARAESAFQLAESRHVEAKFTGWLNAAVADVTVLTSVTAAIAAAEQHADNNYIAQPIIHLSRASAVQAVAAQSAFADGTGRLWTAHGTPIVSSGKYGADVWVTGAVTVLHSPMVVNEGRELTLNTEEAIAERVYGILVDCDYVARYDFTA